MTVAQQLIPPVTAASSAEGSPPPQVTAPLPGPHPRDEIINHLSPLRAFAISLTRSTSAADDLVQDTIVKAWSNIDKFQPGTNMQAWLFTILRNTFFSDRRKHRREVPDPDGLHAASLFELPQHDGKLAFRDFHRAFLQLSAEHREVLILVGASGFSTEQTAKMIGVAVGTVKSRTSRARKRLAELMGMEPGGVAGGAAGGGHADPAPGPVARDGPARPPAA